MPEPRDTVTVTKALHLSVSPAETLKVTQPEVLGIMLFFSRSCIGRERGGVGLDEMFFFRVTFMFNILSEEAEGPALPRQSTTLPRHPCSSHGCRVSTDPPHGKSPALWWSCVFLSARKPRCTETGQGVQAEAEPFAHSGAPCLGMRL